MPQDFFIDLPNGVQSDTIPLTHSREVRDDDLLQRAVTLLLLRKDPEMQISGDSILRVFRKSNSAITSDSGSVLVPVGEALKARLNEEERRVSEVYFEFGEAAAKQSARLVLTVVKTNGETESSVLI